MRYSTNTKFRKYVKGYSFLSFARKFGNKYSKKLMDTATKLELCATDLFSKYAWPVPLEDKRGITIVNAFQRRISKGCKPNKI